MNVCQCREMWVYVCMCPAFLQIQLLMYFYSFIIAATSTSTRFAVSPVACRLCLLSPVASVFCLLSSLDSWWWYASSALLPMGRTGPTLYAILCIYTVQYSTQYTVHSQSVFYVRCSLVLLSCFFFPIFAQSWILLLLSFIFYVFVHVWALVFFLSSISLLFCHKNTTHPYIYYVHMYVCVCATFMPVCVSKSIATTCFLMLSSESESFFFFYRILLLLHFSSDDLLTSKGIPHFRFLNTEQLKCNYLLVNILHLTANGVIPCRDSNVQQVAL